MTIDNASQDVARSRSVSCALFCAMFALLLIDTATAAAAPRKTKSGSAARIKNGAKPVPSADAALPVQAVGQPWPITHAPVRQTTAAIMELERQTPPHALVPSAKPELPYPDRKSLPQNPASPSTSAIPNGSIVSVESVRAGDNAFTARPLLAQTVGTSFTGATLSGVNPTFSFPPDSMGAIGPTQFFVVVNSRMVTFDKATGVEDGVLNVSGDTFFSSVRAGSLACDPRVRFDRLSGRWFVVMINVSFPNRIVLAWSDAASNGVISNTTVWSFAFFVNGAGSSCLADYPTLGIDANALYIGTNLFCNYASSFDGTDGYVISKAGLLAASGTVTRFALASPGGAAGPYTPQGVDNYDPNATEGYFIGVDNISFGKLMLRRVFNPGGAPSISGNIPITLPSTSFPKQVPHLGNTNSTSGYLDAIDDRLFAAHIRNGRLWTAHNITVEATGLSTSYSSTSGRDGVRWYEINGIRSSDNGGVPVIVQSGTVFDSATDVSTARYFWMPSVMVSGQGHAAFGFSTAGTNFHADAATAGRWSSDGAGALQAFSTYTSSTTAYNPPGDYGDYYYGRRWGDYSFTSLDPLDDMTMWTIQEFCDVTNSYGVRVAKLLAPLPATPVSASPPTIAGGVASTVVTVTATSSGGAAFFDPGPDLAPPAVPFNHISATVGGGVVVNSVTYVDPTTVTLDLNTNFAAATTADVTIINPDGQSATGTGLLTIGAGGDPSAHITCPADFAVNTATNATSCGTNVSYTGSHTARANGYPTPTITYSPPNPLPVGTTLVTATATNNLGSQSCTFNVTVIDHTPPAISCPANMRVVAPYGTTSAVVNFTVGASDACGAAPVVSTPASGSSFPLGTTTVNSTGTDAVGNTTSCSFTVTVVAGTALYLVAPCRLLDTRGGTPVPANGVMNLAVTGNCGVPAGATSLAANVAVVNPVTNGLITIYPGPANSVRPLVSTINYTTGRTLANNARITIGPDGTINIFNAASSPVNFLIDVSGYFK